MSADGGAPPSGLDALLREVETLEAIVNAESTPYASHYRIIETLKKWLTTPLALLDAAIANAKLGATYLHVEEPHNAQPALEKAAAFLCPELLAYATKETPSPAAAATTPAPPASKAEIQKLLKNLPVVRLVGAAARPYADHVLELLNQTGILWFNRSLPLRALCYFKACAELSAVLESEPNDADDPSGEVFVALRTHAYFYLAQVYGALQLADESALYCLATLELQLQSYTASAAAAAAEPSTNVHEWIKNGLRLVDYYIETENGAQVAACLDACEFMLRHHLRVVGNDAHAARHNDDDDADTGVTSDERDQRHAEIYLAWARLHQQTLQLAQLHREGVAPEPRKIEYVDRVVRRASLQDTLQRLQTAAAATATASTDGVALTVVMRMKYTPPRDVANYDTARDVFKMGASACEAALKVFVLDGFVTAHIQLLQLQSQLYRRLIAWESDLKRQIAMHLRRLALLTPLLGDVISPRAYCAKLQELYFESAETAAEIFDLKQFKKRGEHDPKTTAYILKAVNWYQQYLYLFYATDDSDATARARVTGADAMIVGGSATLLTSAAATMTPAELKAVLQGYFSLARACSKVVIAQDHEKTVLLWKKAIEYNEAVLTLVKKYAQLPANDSNATRVKEVFKAEMSICEEMLELLPEKINQLVYNGKAL